MSSVPAAFADLQKHGQLTHWRVCIFVSVFQDWQMPLAISCPYLFTDPPGIASFNLVQYGSKTLVCLAYAPAVASASTLLRKTKCFVKILSAFTKWAVFENTWSTVEPIELLSRGFRGAFATTVLAFAGTSFLLFTFAALSRRMSSDTLSRSSFASFRVQLFSFCEDTVGCIPEKFGWGIFERCSNVNWGSSWAQSLSIQKS